jgi:hypothetical protein
MPANLDGLFWLVLFIGPLLLFQRGLHREVQAVLLLLTRRSDITLMLFSLLFFPGVLLHESSHFLVARILGVRTGRFSLLPRPLGNGRLQLGFVETASTDWLRDALIGAAPLVAGGAFVAYAGLARLGLVELWERMLFDASAALATALPETLSRPDFWLWFYLSVTVSSTMLPSASDRRAWLPIGSILALLIAISLLVGAGPWMMVHLAPVMDRVLRSVAVVFAISVLVHLVFLLPLWLMHRLLANLLRMDVA